MGAPGGRAYPGHQQAPAKPHYVLISHSRLACKSSEQGRRGAIVSYLVGWSEGCTVQCSAAHRVHALHGTTPVWDFSRGSVAEQAGPYMNSPENDAALRCSLASTQVRVRCACSDTGMDYGLSGLYRGVVPSSRLPLDVSVVQSVPSCPHTSRQRRQGEPQQFSISDLKFS